MNYKAPDNSLHFLSEEDIANGGERFLPFGYVSITEQEANALRPKPDIETVIEAKKIAVGAVRKQILDILTGIALEAQLKSDTGTTSAYLVVLQGLKDITKDWPTDPALVDALVVQRYAALVAQCTPQMVSAFAQVAS